LFDTYSEKQQRELLDAERLKLEKLKDEIEQSKETIKENAKAQVCSDYIFIFNSIESLLH
jgi:hypothetical protein